MLGDRRNLSGRLRGLLLNRTTLSETVNELWNVLPHPRERYAAGVAQYCGFQTKGRAVLRDLVRLMMREYKTYRQNIPSYMHRIFREIHPDIPMERLLHDPSFGYEMAIDSHEQAACHLAADRAIARLLIAPMPKLEKRREKPWMNLNNRVARANRNIIVLDLVKSKKRRKS